MYVGMILEGKGWGRGWEGGWEGGRVGFDDDVSCGALGGFFISLGWAGWAGWLTN